MYEAIYGVMVPRVYNAPKTNVIRNPESSDIF